MKNIAIVVITYNRPGSLKRLLNRLLEADYDNDDVDLIVSIDHSDKSEENEKIVDQYNWTNGNKYKIVKKRNIGLKKHVLSVGHLTEDYENIIVLEDDIYLSLSFYKYAKSMIKMYGEEEKIAGISLYSFPINQENRLPFIPDIDNFDVYFVQYAQSWGQVWSKEKWRNFIRWYEQKSSFETNCNIPTSLYYWSDQSWLKYHTLYCIEENKYFIYPRVSQSTNFSEVGTHNKVVDTSFQTVLQVNNKKSYLCPVFGKEGIIYDAFFERVFVGEERIKVENNIYINLRDIEFDIYGSKETYSKKYLLSTKIYDFKIIRSYGLLRKPHEINFLEQIKGNEIFLYDTSIFEKNENKHKIDYIYYFSVFDYKLSLKLFFQNIKNYFKIKFKKKSR